MNVVVQDHWCVRGSVDEESVVLISECVSEDVMMIDGQQMGQYWPEVCWGGGGWRAIDQVMVGH
jgi:hypothetical protein